MEGSGYAPYLSGPSIFPHQTEQLRNDDTLTQAFRNPWFSTIVHDQYHNLHEEFCVVFHLFITTDPTKTPFQNLHVSDSAVSLCFEQSL